MNTTTHTLGLGPHQHPAPMLAATVLDTLHRWSEQGWMRRLDSALAVFIHDLDPEASPVLLLCSAVLAQMEGRGHSCLPLAPLVQNLQAVLAWPAKAETELVLCRALLPENLGHWLQGLRASNQVRYAPLGTNISASASASAEPDKGQPLVLSGTPEAPLLYLRRYWVYEEQVVQALTERTRTALEVDTQKALHCLNKLFKAIPVGDQPAEIDWQKVACAVALRGNLTVITGGPGTGKTYTAARLLALLLAMHPEPQNLKVSLAAPTGKAAARLRQSIDQSLQGLAQQVEGFVDLADLAQRIGKAKTVHSLLGASLGTREFRHNAAQPLDVDVLIVDETSMVHLEMMAALLQALPAHAKLILLGDKDQLASVEAGAVLGDLCANADQNRYNAATRDYVAAASGERLPPPAQGRTPALAQHTVMLRHSLRFGSTIGDFAQAVNTGDTVKAANLLTQKDSAGILWKAGSDPSPATVLALAVQGREGAPACYANYLHEIQNKPRPPLGEALLSIEAHEAWVKRVVKAFDQFRILCAVHEGEWGDRALNQGVQRALGQADLLESRGEWFVGRPVMVTRNDPALGVFNGDIGIALPPASGGKALRVYFLDGDSLRSVAVSRLAHVETAFAMTVHKSQGSEFGHTVLVIPPSSGEVMTRELVYTGITRAKNYFSLVEAENGLLTKAICTTVFRASGLQSKLEPT